MPGRYITGFKDGGIYFWSEAWEQVRACEHFVDSYLSFCLPATFIVDSRVTGWAEMRTCLFGGVRGAPEPNYFTISAFQVYSSLHLFSGFNPSTQFFAVGVSC